MIINRRRTHLDEYPSVDNYQRYVANTYNPQYGMPFAKILTGMQASMLPRKIGLSCIDFASTHSLTSLVADPDYKCLRRLSLGTTADIMSVFLSLKSIELENPIPYRISRRPAPK
jgi:hypothetical protein